MRTSIAKPTPARPPAVQIADGPQRALEGLLETLDPEQRAAATLPDGPAQIIAPAGSGKTTTLIARLGHLLAAGVNPERICVVTFNREAALELKARVERRLAPLAPGAGRIEIRTLHALARQILLERSPRLELVADRLPLLRAARRRSLAGRSPEAPPLPPVAALDTWLSVWKVERRLPPEEALPVLEQYARMLAARGARDFDDLVVEAADLLAGDATAAARWRARFTHVCVDEFQDVDAAQLRLVRLLAEPERNLFVVGDDDQTIYAWRLADVRRILDFSQAYPDARRVLLATNYRCPRAVVSVSARLIAVNRERFDKRIVPGAPAAAGDSVGTAHSAATRTSGSTVLAVRTDDPDWPDRLVALAVTASDAGDRCCFLARTRAELAPIALALVRREVPHASALAGPFDAPCVATILEALAASPAGSSPFAAVQAARAARHWRRIDEPDDLGDEDHAALDALAGWSIGFVSLERFLQAAVAIRRRLERLRDPDAAIELVTVHGAKGREWPTVIVIGFEEERFPNRRALVDAVDPTRALEEERRLAYVALTRATERLVLAFDPRRPSRFLAEMGLVVDPKARPRAQRR